MANEKRRKVRVRNGFSDRSGTNPIPKEIQLYDFSRETRVVLFNALKNNLEIQIASQKFDKEQLAKYLVENLFNEVYRKYYDTYESVMDDIQSVFLNDEYHEVLTAIDFIVNMAYESFEDFSARHSGDWYWIKYYQDFRKNMNQTFEDEYVGYRFIDGKIVPITNKEEINAITDSSRTPYEKVNESISKAISFLGEMGKKDYKNSVKESITATEELLNILNGSTGLCLGEAADQLCTKNKIDKALKEAIKKLYGYASNVDGVRHGNNKDNGDITFDEAKYVLLICSATINFLCSQTDKQKGE